MDRLKTFGIWLIIIIEFWLFVNLMIYILLHGEEAGMNIYNMTHKDEVVNVVK